MSNIRKSILFRIIRLISKIQESTMAKHTAYYILTESILLGMIISAFNMSTNLAISNLILSFASYFLFGLSSYVILISRSKNTPAIVELNKYISFILIFISHIPVAFLYFITYNPNSVIVVSSSIIIYTIILIRRNKKYLEDTEFFVNKYSSIQGSWIEASVKLEKSIKHIEKNRLIRSYYWGLRSEWTYNRITRKEALEFKEIAAELSAVGNLISAAALSGDVNVYKKDIYKTLESAFSMTNKQICSKCNQQLQIGSIHHYEKKDNLCNNCDRINDSINKQTRSKKRDPFWEKYSKENLSKEKRKTSSDNTRKKRRERRRNSKSYRKRRRRKSKKSKNNNTNKTEQSKNNTKDKIEKYLDVLELNQNPTVSELKESYRKKVKQTHPDSGGSPEQFKKVKNAYTKLKENIDNDKRGK